MPTAVFLDTSIIGAQQFNFSSTALTTFAPVCKKQSMKLLLPDPTEREIRRQIKNRSQEAFEALEEARRKVPFLGKWSALASSPRLKTEALKVQVGPMDLPQTDPTAVANGLDQAPFGREFDGKASASV